MKLLRLVFLLLFIDYGSAANMTLDTLRALVDGCPAANENCQRLQFNSENVAVCPHKLWVSSTELIWHSATKTLDKTTTWSEIKLLKLDQPTMKGWIGYGDLSHYPLELSQKVSCAPNIPRLLVWTTMYEGSNEISDLVLFSPKERCGRGHIILRNDGSTVGFCVCPYGWDFGPKDVCDDPIDPFGIAVTSFKPLTSPTAPLNYIQDTCNILLAEGCPDEEQDKCVKLRFNQYGANGAHDQAYCPYTLWLSNDKSWEEIHSISCDWTSKEWMVKRNDSSEAIVLDSRRRVQCAESIPTSNNAVFNRPTKIVDETTKEVIWTTHFCFHNFEKCENGGHCVHSYRPSNRQPSVATYCVCPHGFSGERCEVKKTRTEAIADNPVCSLLLADSCDGWHCEPLRLNKATQAIDCPWTLWVSNTQSMHHVYTETNHFATNWTEIEELRCKDEKWEITFTDEKGRRSEELSLGRKVMCAKNQPFRDADAFWEHRNFFPTRANFASVHSSPLAYCNDETGWIECLGDNGYCTLEYKGGKFVPTCSCKWGFRDSSVGQCRGEYDPYGLELELEDSDNFVAEPLPGATLETCNVFIAEGCPDHDHHFSKKNQFINCTKLRPYGSGVVCPRKLWMSDVAVTTYTIQPWAQIDSLECKNKRWTVRVGGKEEVLPGNRLVACATEKPIAETKFLANRVPEWIRPRHRALDEQGGWNTYCFRNKGRCEDKGGYCIHMHDQDYKTKTYKQKTNCVCLWNPFLSKHFIVRYHKPTCDREYDKDIDAAPGTANDNTKQICEPALLEDGCTDDNCVKLKGNSTHAICNELLWLNYGGNFFMDWHEVSGVHCVDNQWQTECSKKIGHSKLMCSKHAPSSISSSLYLTIIISAVVIILLIALTCACCLLRSKQRRVQQAASLARTPHSSRHPSTAHSAREEDSDEK